MSEYTPTVWTNDMGPKLSATNFAKLETAVDEAEAILREFGTKKARAATTANITLSGTQTIDGTALAVGERCFVKSQTNGAQNGIYLVASGAWTRTSDSDSAAEFGGGTLISVERGTANGGKVFRCTNNTAVTIGTTVLTFAEVHSQTAPTGAVYTTDGTTPLKYSAFLAAASGNHQAAFQNAINVLYGPDVPYRAMLDLEGAKVELTAPVVAPTGGGGTGTRAIFDGTIEAQSSFSGGDHMITIMGDVPLIFLRLINIDFRGQNYASWIKWDKGNLFIESCRFSNPKPGTNFSTMKDKAGLYCSDGGTGGNADAGFFIATSWLTTGDAQVLPKDRWTMGLLSQTGDNKIGGSTTMSYFRHCCQFEAPGIVIGELHCFQGNPGASMTDHTASIRFTNGRCGATLNGLYLDKSFIEISNDTNVGQTDIGEIAISNMHAYAESDEAGFAFLVVRDYSGGSGTTKVSDITVTNSQFINGGSVAPSPTKLHNTSAFDRQSYMGILFANNTFERTSGAYDVLAQANPVTLRRNFSGNTAQKAFSTTGYFPFGGRPQKLISAFAKPTGGTDTTPQPLALASISSDNINIDADAGWIGDLTIQASCNTDVGAFQDG